MEASLTATNVHVKNHISDDIILSIMSKLPLKSFKRFECVRKSWSLLFYDPYFTTMYRNNFLSKDCSSNDDTCLLVGVTKGYEYSTPMCSVLVDDLYSLSGENFENSVKLDWPNPFSEDEDLDPDGDADPDEGYSGFGIMGFTSVNGILCLCAFHHSDMKLILWNPTTNEFKVIPSGPPESEHFFMLGDITLRRHLLGYDHIKDDYKVIRFIECDGDIDDDNYDDDELVSFWEIYSLNGNLWRKIDVKMPLFFDNKEVYMDGVSHWWDKSVTHAYLVSFDFSNESFTTTLIPSYIYDDNFGVSKDLVILNGSIAFILIYFASTIHISVLGELGVKESWTKLFVIGPSPYLIYPIVAAKKGKILFRNRDSKHKKGGLVWFDLSTGMIDKIDLTTQISGRVSTGILFHKESILPIKRYEYGY